MNVTLDNNYTIPTGSIKEVYSIVYLDNKITFTISDEHIIYNYLYHKIDTALDKFFTNEAKIEKAYYQEKEIIDNRIIILVKKEYEKDEFTQSKFPLLELDSIEFFSLSRTLIIV